MRLFDILIAWVAIATFVAATPSFVAETPIPPEIAFEANVSSIVPKTVFSSKLRLVFVVGLEGTGHHFMESVNKHMFRHNKYLVRVPNEDFNGEFYHTTYSMAQGVSRYSEALDSARDDMRKLAQRGAEMGYPGTMVLTHGRFSYPNGFGPNKALKYFDLRILAEIAEEEGVDLRVLYLQRSVKDALLSDTVHRKFQNGLHNEGQSTPQERYMQYMQVLLTDIAVMHSFLEELDPRFVMCFHYDRAGDANQSALVANFLAPNEVVAKALNHSLVTVAHPYSASAEPLPYEGLYVVASRFRRKLDVFESQLCSAMRQG